VAGHVHGQLQPAPDSQFVKGTAQMVLDDLLGGANDFADFAIGETFPDQACDLNLFISLSLSKSLSK
jgi:hypothetical protein